jgi:acyl carrier protein
MELEKFVKQFAEQFDDTDASEIKANTAFHDLEEWGSLVAMGVIALAKTKYGKTITGKEIKACKTVEDLYHAIVSK